MPKRALIIRHNEFETLGENYTSVLNDRGFHLHPLNVFESATDFTDFNPPPLADLNLIIALGGALSANDDFPAIHAEDGYSGGDGVGEEFAFGVDGGEVVVGRECAS